METILFVIVENSLVERVLPGEVDGGACPPWGREEALERLVEGADAAARGGEGQRVGVDAPEGLARLPGLKT